MARRELTDAEKMLNELRVIPKMVRLLKKDIEKTRSSVLSSPQWSDMRVSGGVRQSQEDKNVAIIDMTDYNINEMERLICRRSEIIDLVMSMPDMVQRHLLLVTYVDCKSFDEAMERLEISRNKYYAIKRIAIRNLDELLAGQT